MTSKVSQRRRRKNEEYVSLDVVDRAASPGTKGNDSQSGKQPAIQPSLSRGGRMAPGLKHGHYPEEEEQLESTLGDMSALPSFSGAAISADLPEPGLEPKQRAPLPVPKNLRSTTDLPGVKTVTAAQVEKDQLISAANLAADKVREDARKNAARKREETLSAAIAEREREKKAMVEKVKKEALAFKSRKVSSVPKVANAVFSKVFGDLF